MKQLMKSKTMIAGLALTTLLISGNSFALGWSVEAKSDVRTNTQEAGRDANRDSNNRFGDSDNIGGSQVINSHNRVNAHDIGGNATIVEKGIRVGNDYTINATPKSGSIDGADVKATSTMAPGRTFTTKGGNVTGATGIQQSGFATGGTRNNQSIKDTTIILGNVSNQ